MNIPVHIDSMKDAEKLAGICKSLPDEMLLRSGPYCIDPKSTLGILAMMYAAHHAMYLDTCEMDKEAVERLLGLIKEYLIREDADQQ